MYERRNIPSVCSQTCFYDYTVPNLQLHIQYPIFSYIHSTQSSVTYSTQSSVTYTVPNLHVHTHNPIFSYIYSTKSSVTYSTQSSLTYTQPNLQLHTQCPTFSYIYSAQPSVTSRFKISSGTQILAPLNQVYTAALTFPANISTETVFNLGPNIEVLVTSPG
jgi:hypothetical protein